MKKWTVMKKVMLAVMVAACVSGCGKQSATSVESDNKTGNTETTQTKESETAIEETLADAEYDDDATIVWGLTSQWADLTPFDNSAGGYYSGMINSLIYDKLVYCKMDGSIEERAAQNWEVSEDKKIFTFYLNPNSKFHDGEPATAEDWVFAAKLLANPEAGFADHSPAMSIIAGTNDTGDLIDEENFGFKALDSTTLEITLKNSMNASTFLQTYSYYYTCLPEHILGECDPVDIVANEFFTKPIGSGPCKFENLNAGSELTLSRNTEYPIGEAHYSKMVYKIMSTTALATALMTGEIDIPYVGVTTDEALELESAENLQVNLGESADSLMWMPINNKRVTDVRIRQAINYAINKELIATQLQQGLAEPVETFLAPGSEYIPDSIQYEYNPEKAKELLEAAKAEGYDGKFIIATPSGIRERMCALMEQDLEKIGFDVEIQVMEAATMFAELKSGADCSFDAGVVGRGISPDVCYFNADLNYQMTGYPSVTDPTYVEYQEKFIAAQSEEEANEIMSEYLEYVHEQCPIVFLTASKSYRVFSDRVGDIGADYSAISMRDFGVWNWKVSK